MNALLKSAAALAAAAVTIVVAAMPATAASGSTPSPNDACANPVLARGARWSSTACDYVLATTTPPSTSPTTPPTTSPTTSPTTPPSPPGPGDGIQAATALGWGTPVDGDEFEGATLDTTTWGAYNSARHGGNGWRRPAQIAVANGVMTMSGTAGGTTGGMELRTGRLYGRWETRMQVPKGDSRYHPVLILWPDAEDWPTGGEVDYAETTAASSKVDFFLHYSASNKQTSASTTLDITQWHNYAVEWTSTGIRGYVDGVLWFTDTTAAHLPPRSMHPV